jgi:hypothetical protein
MARVEYVGHVVNPLRERARRRQLIAADGESLASPATSRPTDIEDAGGIAAEGSNRWPHRAARRAMGGFAPGFNETNDQTART